MAESLLSSHDSPGVAPASTYRLKRPVTIVDTNCPPIPISTSEFTSSHSLSAHLDSSNRGLLRRHSLSTHLDPSHRGVLRRHSLSTHLDPSHRGVLRRHSLSTDLDPSHRGVLPVSLR